MRQALGIETRIAARWATDRGRKMPTPRLHGKPDH